jgi:hypothetical protein
MSYRSKKLNYRFCGLFKIAATFPAALVNNHRTIILSLEAAVKEADLIMF